MDNVPEIKGTILNMGDYPKRTQVWRATHKETGNRLSPMNRAFISFTFGGELIEDFNLIAVFEGDRYNTGAYAEFEDLTETYDVIDGQFYWGSHFTSHQFDFTLATDGMTEENLDEFKRWFCPGKERELVLSEHPNRAILARVATPPVISMVPFGEEVVRKFANEEFTQHTTIYKGTINLSLVADKPLWYSKLNLIFPYHKNELYRGIRKGNKLCNVDYRKIILEDKIPHIFMLSSGDASPIILGQDLNDLANEYMAEGRVYPIFDGATLGQHATEWGFVGIDTKDWEQYFASIAVKRGETIPLYYAGTAKTKPTITFSFRPDWYTYKKDANNPEELVLSKQYDGKYGLICHPRNNYLLNIVNDGVYYNTVSIKDQDGNRKVFKFTTPSIYTGYNQATYLARKHAVANKAFALVDFIDELKSGINEYYSRAWAVLCARATTSGITDGTIKAGEDFWSEFVQRMGGLFLYCGEQKVTKSGVNEGSPDYSGTSDYKPVCFPATITINSETGEAVGKFRIRKGSTINDTRLDGSHTYSGRNVYDETASTANYSTYTPVKYKLDENNNRIYTNFIEIEENVGDMICSDYLTIEGQDGFTDSGYIIDGNTKKCHTFTTDYPEVHGLTDVQILYQNMYY